MISMTSDTVYFVTVVSDANFSIFIYIDFIEHIDTYENANKLLK